MSNQAGSVPSQPAIVNVTFSRLVNLSTRGLVQRGGALTPGFVIRGLGNKRLVVRGVGPTLSSFGVGRVLSDLGMEIVPVGATAPLYINDDWDGSTTLSNAFASVGGFALPIGSKDAALQADLASGGAGYTVRIAPSGTAVSGIALAEIYDADSDSSAARLVNVSTLGFGGAGEEVLAVGFSIRGSVSKRLLIRAIGPGLAQFSVSGTMTDPRITVMRQGDSTAAGGNNDWGGTAALKTAFATAGAFSLPDASLDAAVVLTLPPGTYSATVNVGATATGVVLVEVYDID